MNGLGYRKKMLRLPLTLSRRFCFVPVLILAVIVVNLHASSGQRQLVLFEQDRKWGYMNENGRVVIEAQFIMAHDFSPEGIAAVVDESGWAYIDKKGRVVIRPFIFDNGPDYFREGLARFTKENKFGFFDKKGRMVIRPEFDFALPFHEGLSAICMGCREVVIDGEHSMRTGGKWGYIDKKGQIVIPLEFGNASNFENGKARVELNGEFLYIDKNGRKQGPSLGR